MHVMVATPSTVKTSIQQQLKKYQMKHSNWYLFQFNRTGIGTGIVIFFLMIQRSTDSHQLLLSFTERPAPAAQH